MKKKETRNILIFCVALICVLLLVIIILEEQFHNDYVYPVEKENNGIFSEDYFRNVETAELVFPQTEGEEILTDADAIQELVTILSGLDLTDSSENISAAGGVCTLRFLYSDGEEESVMFSESLLGVSDGEGQITYELDEGVYEEIIALFEK